MVASILAGVVALVAPHPCRAPLPHGPRVPAPLVMWTDCGAFRIARDGNVARLPPHWLAGHGAGTGRRWEATVQIRRNRAGRFFLVRDGRGIWRSRRSYPNDGGSVNLGPHEFAFASFRRGIFLADFDGAERLVARGRGLYPYAFTSAGDLIVCGGRTLIVVARDGRTVRRLHFRVRRGFAFDERTETLFFVTRRGRLARMHARHVSVGRRVAADGSISAAQHGVVVFVGARRITITRAAGAVVARTPFGPRPAVLDSGVSIAPDGLHFAFRITQNRRRSQRARASVYVLRAGATHATLLYRHRLGASGCAVGANLDWHGRFLVYSSTDGRRAIVDTRAGAVTDLGRLARAVPRRGKAEIATVAWAAEFR